MKATVTKSTFTDAMKDTFTYEAIQALWDYFDESELDPVAFRHEFSEYSSLEDFHNDYDKEEYSTMEDIENSTTVIPFEKTEGFLIRDF